MFKTLTLAILLNSSIASASDSKSNELVEFLTGKWDNISFEIADKRPVKKEEYRETMVAKDSDTLTITAHGFRNGKDLTKDMHLEVHGNEAVMTQGNFKATGTREDKVYSLKAVYEGNEYRLRLYTLGDKYVFHRETWKNGKIQQIDMSYLLRK